MSFGTMGVDWEERVNFERLRKERFERVSEALDDSGLGLLLCYEFNNIRYITGFRYNEWARDKLMAYTMVPKGSDHPVFFHFGSRYFVTQKEAPWLAKDMRFLKGLSAATLVFPGGLIQTAAENFVEEIKSIRKQYGVADLPIGIDVIPNSYLAKTLDANHVEWQDAWKPMMQARIIKTRDEIELMKISAAVADGMYDALARSIRPGIRENELQGIANNALYSLGADCSDALNVMSGPRTNPNHHDCSDRIVRPGELMFFDTYAGFMGYRTCYYRTFSVGRATKAQKQTYQAAHDMLYDAIRKVTPGATTTEIGAVWPEPSYFGRKNQVEAYADCVGHGIGLSVHEPPAIQRGCAPYPLKKDMIIALETWAGPFGGDHGARLEETLLITDSGYEILTKFPVHSLPECMGGWYDAAPE